MTTRTGGPSRLTAVLPVAGAGARFGARYPKELHCIAPGVSVLDRSIAPIVRLAESGYDVRVIAVVNPDRHATLAYLAELAERLEVVIVFQRPGDEAGAAGAVERALPLCTGAVLIVLPDQYFELPQHANPLADALHELGTSDWVALAAKVTDAIHLRDEGTLHVTADGRGHVVSAAAEKPSDIGPYNAVWASVLCVASEAPSLGRLFDRTAESPLVGARAVLVDGYRHLSHPVG